MLLIQGPLKAVKTELKSSLCVQLAYICGS